ncbi:MAG: hypothetical protein ACLFT2_05555 [Candidatus Brocadiia bacterium]
MRKFQSSAADLPDAVFIYIVGIRACLYDNHIPAVWLIYGRHEIAENNTGLCGMDISEKANGNRYDTI